MKFPADYKPEFDSMKTLLLEMAEDRCVDTLLKRIVERFATRPHVALTRIWLRKPGDVCSECRMKEACTNPSDCLHLVASAGNPLEKNADWSRLDGEFRRFPLGIGKVGEIAATGRPEEVLDLSRNGEWLSRREWVRQEEIRSFVGQPMLHRGEVLGVVSVFLRIRPLKEGTFWMRMIADHAAIAIANARAFEEIERLKKQAELENEYLREAFERAGAYGDILGRSPALKNVLDQIELAAPTDANVLIYGETGTGKELIAREIHHRSPRKHRALVKVNCAAIPRDRFKSELFGRARDRAGLFQLADGGTLLLDEVGEIPLELQPKILQVLHDKQYCRVGEDTPRAVDMRVIAATSRDLKADAESGRYRQDFYYHLHVFHIEVAPLRQRPEDIGLLASHFLKTATKNKNVPSMRLTQANVLELQRYDWPGNVKELQNVIERAVITARKGRLVFDLPGKAKAAQPPAGREAVPDAEIRALERENILLALDQAGGKVYGAGGAADILGLKPTTLASRIKKLKIKKPPS
jgi:transcriptional regulator with GAF, ATPase, and Fis domain